jgi:hypothetical protein
MAPLDLLHGLRLRGFVETATLAEVLGRDEHLVGTELENLAAEGLVKRHEARLSGWMLTNAGRAEGEHLLHEQLEHAGSRGAVSSAYAAFLQMNGEFLQLCTDWQVRVVDGDSVVNDHVDEVYDQHILDRFAEIIQRVGPICVALQSALERFSSYSPRLQMALTRAQRGDTEWLTKPMIDSVHTVWFELHEDLLATLNIERTKEGH